MAKKPIKKSVSFSSSKNPQPTEVKPLKTDEIVNPESPEEDPSESQDNITFPFSVKSLPLPAVSLSLVLGYQDFTTRDLVLSYLTKQNLTLTIFQLAYATIFLSSLVETRKSKHKHIKFNFGKDWTLLVFTLIIASFATLPIYILLVLFGAPFNPAYFHENALLSWQIANLMIPLILAYLKLGNIFSKLGVQLALIVLFGCWLGAIVVPLDWDRPWQTWPLPIVFGSYIGGALAYTIGGLF